MVELALQGFGDPAEDVGEPGLGIDVFEFDGADQGVHGRRLHAASVEFGEQPGSSSETKQ